MSRRPAIQRRRHPRRQPLPPRGVALIFVLTTVAILAAVAADFSYNTRVNVELAVNSRDSLRAQSMAMSAMNMSRLVLRFQRQVDGMSMGGLGSIMGMLGGGDPSQLMAMAAQMGLPPDQLQGILGAVAPGAGMTAPPGAPGQTGPGMAGGMAPGRASGPSIRLWEIIPVDSGATQAFLGGMFAGERDANDLPMARPGDEATPIVADFGQFQGSFHANIVDEDQKINLQRLHYSLLGGPLATLVQLSVMMEDPKYDFIFNREDANRERVDRQDVIVAIKDWIDEDETGSAIDMTAATNPFIPGFGDENGPYSRYKRRYRAKNAKFDTLAELHMVQGVSDAFMAAFGDRLTVYPDTNNTININTTDPVQMLVNILTAAANPMDPALRDPLRLELIMEQIRLARMFPFIGMTVQHFVAILQANGIQVKPEVVQGAATSLLGDRSSTFRVEAFGEAGRVQKKLTAVVRYDDGMGQLLYWRED